MTITTVAVTGTLTPPNDVPTRGTLRFALSGFDMDTETNLVAPLEFTGPINTSGAFSVDVWPPSRGAYARTYTVTAEYPATEPGKSPTIIPIVDFLTFNDDEATLTLGEIIAGLPVSYPLPGGVWQNLLADTEAAAAAAAAAEAAAEAALDSFDDRYLGAKASDPSVDNDGNALLTGALYFNTSSDEMRVWSGSVWIALDAVLPQGLATTDSPTFAGATINGNIGVTGTVDGRDVAADGTKLDGIEVGADVTDTANVAAAGAAMLTGATFTGDVVLNSSTPEVRVGGAATTTGKAKVKVGNGRTGDGGAQVDLISDTTYTDYGLQLIRFGGANATSQLTQRGTGNLFIKTEDSAALVLQTSNTTRLTISSAGTSTFTGDVTLNKDAPRINVGGAATTTGLASVEIGNGRTGDGAAAVDFVTDTAVYTDYGLRVVKYTGANADSDILHRGTGILRIKTQEAAAIEFRTSNTIRLTISSGGDATFTGGVSLTGGVLKKDQYTVAGLPSAGGSNQYGEIFVTDEAGGPVPAFSDGTNWRRVTDGAVVS